MGQIEKYKKIRKIVAALVLATAITNGLEIKYYHQAPLTVTEKQYWHNGGNAQDLQENIPVNLVTQNSNQIENEQNRHNSDQQRSSMTVIRRTDLTKEDRLLNFGSLLSSLKCPSLKISLDLLSSHNCERSSIKRCIADKCRKQIEKLSMQQPLYVDEPSWVEIELDYADKLPYNFNKEDPFFVTRGKKIFKAMETSNDDIQDNDHENFLDEVKRSTGSADVNLKDDRSKRNSSKRKEERRSKPLQLNNRQLEDLVRHLDPINDPFFLSRGKKHFRRGTIQEVSLDDLETEMIGKKSHEETKRSVRIESKQSENNEVTNVNRTSLVMDNVTSSESNVTTSVSSRTKRHICMDFDCGIDESEKTTSWMDDLKKTIFDSSYVQQRDKHSDISDIFNEPFFISRGKKNTKNINPESTSTTPIDYNYSSSSLEAAKRVLLRLLHSRRCNSKACKDLDKFASKTYETMRDRRSFLDDLLRKYDPFYVARGKRLRSSNSFEKDQKQTRISQQGEIYSKDRVSYDVLKALGDDKIVERDFILN